MSKAAELAALIGSQSALSNRNLFVNGGMQIHQRGNQTSSSGSSIYLLTALTFTMFLEPQLIYSNLQWFLVGKVFLIVF